jgi:hypothetical protein
MKGLSQNLTSSNNMKLKKENEFKIPTITFKCLKGEMDELSIPFIYIYKTLSFFIFKVLCHISSF